MCQANCQASDFSPERELEEIEHPKLKVGITSTIHFLFPEIPSPAGEVYTVTVGIAR